MARRLLILVLAFVAMVLGIEGIRRLGDWWNGVLPAPTFLDFLLMAGLPIIGWLWWRYLSPFGKGRGQCLFGTCRRDDSSTGQDYHHPT